MSNRITATKVTTVMSNAISVQRIIEKIWTATTTVTWNEFIYAQNAKISCQKSPLRNTSNVNISNNVNIVVLKCSNPHWNSMKIHTSRSVCTATIPFFSRTWIITFKAAIRLLQQLEWSAWINSPMHSSTNWWQKSAFIPRTDISSEDIKWKYSLNSLFMRGNLLSMAKWHTVHCLINYCIKI